MEKKVEWRKWEEKGPDGLRSLAKITAGPSLKLGPGVEPRWDAVMSR